MDANKAHDPLSDNIHMRSTNDEDPTVVDRLKKHHAMLKAADKYLDFVRHVETEARGKYERDLHEIQMMDASGITNTASYADI